MEIKTKENIAITDIEYFEKTLQLKEDKIIEIIKESDNIEVIKSRLGDSHVVDRKVYDDYYRYNNQANG